MDNIRDIRFSWAKSTETLDMKLTGPSYLVFHKSVDQTKPLT